MFVLHTVSLTIVSLTHSHTSALVGLSSQPSAQGRLQTCPHQLLCSNVSQPNSEHHPLQVGQEEKGSLWSTHGMEDGKGSVHLRMIYWPRFMFYPVTHVGWS